jgi:hypothetical protein
MRTLDMALYIGLPLMIGGLICWNIGAEIAKAWLRKNDPMYQEPSALAKMFIGGLFTAIGPVKSYARLRRERNEPTTAASLFWWGIAASVSGLVVFLGLLAAGAN